MFAASCDALDQNKKFAASLELDYPILSDPDGLVARAYGVTTRLRPYPHRWTFIIGADRKILFVDRQVSPKSHGLDIANRLKSLGVARSD